MPRPADVMERLRKIDLDNGEPEVFENASQLRDWRRHHGDFGLDAATARKAQEFVNAMSVEHPETGGYLLSEKVSELFGISQVEDSVMQSLATIDENSSRFQVNPVFIDGTNEGRIMIDGDTPTFTDVAFGSKPSSWCNFFSDPVRVSRSLMQDCPQMAAALILILGGRIARKKNRTFTVGNGRNEPQGICAGATVGKTAASATAVTVAECWDLIGSVNSCYTERGTSRPLLMMHPLTLAALRKLASNEFELSGLARVPRILNSHMPTMAANSKAILYGNFRLAYKVFLSEARMIQDTENYAEYGQTAYGMFEFADGTTIDPDAVKSIQMAAS